LVTKHIIHRGQHEIGGMCIEVAADDGTRILLDLGMPLQAPDGGDFPRGTPQRPTEQLIAEGVLVEGPGVFPQDPVSPDVAAIVLTHSHLDHYGLAHHAHSAIPVYGSRGTLAVLEAARAEGTRRVVHTSTSETYGSAQFEPMDESHPIVAQSPYAATKVAADQLAGSYFRSFDVPVTTLRPFNTFGPRQSMRAVLPTLMAQALYSDRIVAGSLTPVRDMNYVSDTVAAFLGVGAAEGVEGELFNVGSGTGRTIADMLAAIQRVVGVEKPVEQEEARIRPEKSEVMALICDYRKAQAAFGYEPHVDFEEGLVKLRDYLVGGEMPAGLATYHV